MQSLKERISQYRARIKRAKEKIIEWNKSGVKGWFQVSVYTKEVDAVVRSLLKGAFKKASPSYSVVALGGYGRKELNLCSDLDIMFLWNKPLGEAEEESINIIVQMLWDLGLDVGHSYRSVDEAIIVAVEDDATKCSYLDTRLLGGSLNPFIIFTKRIKEELLGKDPVFFYNIMDSWLEERYNRYGSSMYLLEPNVKESPGCLRDLHMCYWIGKEIYSIVSFSDFKKKGLLTPLEYETLQEARDFLWRIRNAVHQRRRRKNDILTIDLQPEVAYQLGYRDTRKLLAVEYFMRDFYNHVRNVRKVTKAFLMRTKEEIFPERTVQVHPIRVLLEERFSTPADFIREVISLLKQDVDFDELYKGFWVPPLHWKDHLIFSEDTKDALVELLSQPNSYEALSFLHEIGFLERIIPEFGKITGLMQFDLYHKFTVDEHTLLAVKNLEALPKQNHSMYILLQKVYEKLIDKGQKYLLVLALLLHDIGKGKGGGHSARGARIASEVMEKLKFSEEDIEVVTFLVRNHTVMSEYAFRRDTGDKKTVASFASLVGSLDKLDLLYLLTYADVSAISPDLWNEWKAALLHELYWQTYHILSVGDAKEGMEAISFDALAGEISRSLKDTPKDKVIEKLRVIPEENLFSWSADMLGVVVSAMIRAEKEGVAIEWHSEDLEVTKMIVVDATGTVDVSKVFGVISSRRANIQAANLIYCSDGMCIYVIDITLPDFRPLRDRRLKEDLARYVKNALEGKLNVEEELKKRHVRLSGKERIIKISPKIRLSNSIIDKYTVVEVKAQDRIGLLYIITKTLLSLGLRIHSARVDTEGNRAVDTFYVTKDGAKLKEYHFPEVVRRLKAELE